TWRSTAWEAAAPARRSSASGRRLRDFEAVEQERAARCRIGRFGRQPAEELILARAVENEADPHRASSARVPVGADLPSVHGRRHPLRDLRACLAGELLDDPVELLRDRAEPARIVGLFELE